MEEALKEVRAAQALVQQASERAGWSVEAQRRKPALSPVPFPRNLVKDEEEDEEQQVQNVVEKDDESHGNPLPHTPLLNETPLSKGKLFTSPRQVKPNQVEGIAETTESLGEEVDEKARALERLLVAEREKTFRLEQYFEGVKQVNDELQANLLALLESKKVQEERVASLEGALALEKEKRNRLEAILAQVMSREREDNPVNFDYNDAHGTREELVESLMRYGNEEQQHEGRFEREETGRNSERSDDRFHERSDGRDEASEEVVRLKSRWRRVPSTSTRRRQGRRSAEDTDAFISKLRARMAEREERIIGSESKLRRSSELRHSQLGREERVIGSEPRYGHFHYEPRTSMFARTPVAKRLDFEIAQTPQGIRTSSASSSQGVRTSSASSTMVVSKLHVDNEKGTIDLEMSPEKSKRLS